MNRKYLLPLFVVLGLFLVTGAILTYFGQIQTTITVEQAIELSGTTEFSESLVGGQSYETDEVDIVNNNPERDIDLDLTQSCMLGDVEDCSGIYYTGMIGLSVTGFENGDDPFYKNYYRTVDYDTSLTLDELNDVVYKFEITESDFTNNLAPYVVLVGEGIGSYNVAVQMIPDGETYNIGERYEKTLEDATFHVPGDSECTQSAPCTLSRIQEKFDADLSKLRLAIGAWPGTHEQIISAVIGVSKINNEQAEVKSFKILALETLPFFMVYEPDISLEEGTYVLTTEIQPSA